MCEGDHLQTQEVNNAKLYSIAALIVGVLNGNIVAVVGASICSCCTPTGTPDGSYEPAAFKRFLCGGYTQLVGGVLQLIGSVFLLFAYIFYGLVFYPIWAVILSILSAVLFFLAFYQVNKAVQERLEMDPEGRGPRRPPPAPFTSTTAPAPRGYDAQPGGKFYNAPRLPSYGAGTQPTFGGQAQAPTGAGRPTGAGPPLAAAVPAKLQPSPQPGVGGSGFQAGAPTYSGPTASKQQHAAAPPPQAPLAATAAQPVVMGTLVEPRAADGPPAQEVSAPAPAVAVGETVPAPVSGSIIPAGLVTPAPAAAPAPSDLHRVERQG